MGIGVLPDFLLIGAQKCGTTTLYRALRDHPEVAWSTPKEVHYFDKHHRRGPAFYRSHFPSRVRLAWRSLARGRRIRVGEGSPQYLFHPRAPERARALVPEAKLLALVRDPVDRAWSHYRMAERKERAGRPFADIVEDQIARLAGREALDLREEWKAHFGDGDKPYLAKGIYVDGLANWLRHFPRERLLVIHSADLFERPEATLAEVQAFLGLRTWSPPTVGQHNAEREAPLDPAVRQHLAAFFRPHNERLFALLGRRFEWG
jgi:hypothetical protein